VAFVIRHDPVTRIGKPDRSVRMHREIIRGVQWFSLKMIRQHRDRSVVFGSREPARVVLTSKQPALAIAVIAVAVVRWTAEGADLSSFLLPTQHSVIGDVAEQEVAPIAKPYRPFRPSRACIEALDGCISNLAFCETRIDHLHGRIGVEHRVPSFWFSSKSERFKRKRRGKPGSHVHKCAPLHCSSRQTKSDATGPYITACFVQEGLVQESSRHVRLAALSAVRLHPHVGFVQSANRRTSQQLETSLQVGPQGFDCPGDAGFASGSQSIGIGPPL